MSGLTMLGQVLHEEHFRILVCICDLQNRVVGQAGERTFNPDDDREHEEMHGLIGSLDRVLAHHAFEENVIFPLIRGDGDPDVADLLEEEHVEIEPTTQRLRAVTVNILQHGPSNGRWSEFRTLAQKLFSQMLGHLEKEEAIILQRLDRLLDAATDHRLASQHLSSRLVPAVASSSGMPR
ncbi:MAG: hemerythrin domain-containing protein [Rhodospirillales bacterium]|nr:hemerythrin domain-containing protein [Rhodospirillales bacterium]